MQHAAHWQEVRRIVRSGDPDRYAATLFAPSDAWPHLFALYAFNVELARIAEQVKEPQLAEIKLQWWRETLARARAGEITGHPVADALAGTILACDVPLAAIDGLIDARHFDIGVRQMPDLAALDAYLDATAGTLFSLAAHILAPEEAPALATASRAAGLSYGLTGLMRALPFHVAQGRIDFPADELEARGISVAAIYEGEITEPLLNLLADWRERAAESLIEATQQLSDASRRVRRAYLPLALVTPYLQALEERGDPFRDRVDINPLSRLWRLATWRYRG